MLVSPWLIGFLVVVDVDVETVAAVVSVVAADVGVVEVGVVVVVLAVFVVVSVVAPVVASAACSKLVLLNKNAALIAIAILFLLNMGLHPLQNIENIALHLLLVFSIRVMRLR